MKLIEQMLNERQKDIEAALPPMLKAQAKDFVRLALVDLPRQRALLDVAVRAPARILIALMDIARMGLFPGSKLGEAYVVPFKTKGNWDCQAIIGYRGFLKLARRSGEIADIRARVVCRGDTFDIDFGTSERIVHKPALDTDRGDPENLLGIYCVAEFKGGGNHIEWMSASEIWEVAKRSATYSHDVGKHTSGPWVTDYVEMCKKTVARRGSKWWPLTVDAAEAIGRDEEREIVVEAEAAGQPLALGMTGGFRVFDTSRFDDAEPDPVQAQQSTSSQPAAQTQATQSQPAQQSGPAPRARKPAPPQPSAQQSATATTQGTPGPISPEEAEAILRREAAERQAEIERQQAERMGGWANGD